MSSAPTSSKPSPWLFDPVRDLLLVIGTPLLIVPATLLLRGVWADESLILIVAAFGQLGHVLPGLMRAYGDRELFCRYRTRFLLAPLLIGLACCTAVVWNLHALALVATLWAIWHALMQTFGFARIYAAKAGDRSKWSSRLDLAICLLWFGGALLLNDGPLTLLLNRWYRSGGFFIPSDLLSGFRAAWSVALVTATAAFVVYLLAGGLARIRQHLVKLMILLSSIGFYWYCYASISNLLVGAALFEIFHDVQYLSIVWLFNRKRVEQQQASATPFFRYLFRGSPALVALYVGLVFAFGGIKFLEALVPAGAGLELLTGVLATLGILHYYYDGFIWKIRDAATGSALDIQADRPAPFVSTLAHGAKWAVGLLPVMLLVGAQLTCQRTRSTHWLWIADSLPHCGPVQADVGRMMAEEQRWDEARRCLLRALAVDAADESNRLELARTCVQLRQFQEAERHLRVALRRSPKSARICCNLGIVFAQQQRWSEAARCFHTALNLGESPDSHYNLANIYAAQGEVDLAAKHYQRALQLDPNFAQAKVNLDRLRTGSPQS